MRWGSIKITVSIGSYSSPIILPPFSLNYKILRERDIAHIHNPRNMPLHGRTTQQQINLVIIIPEAAEVLDNAETGLAVGNGGVEVVLFAGFVDGEAFEVDIAARPELRFYGAGDVNGGFHRELFHGVL